MGWGIIPSPQLTGGLGSVTQQGLPWGPSCIIDSVHKNKKKYLRILPEKCYVSILHRELYTSLQCDTKAAQWRTQKFWKRSGGGGRQCINLMNKMRFVREEGRGFLQKKFGANRISHCGRVC